MGHGISSDFKDMLNSWDTILSEAIADKFERLRVSALSPGFPPQPSVLHAWQQSDYYYIRKYVAFSAHSFTEPFTDEPTTDFPQRHPISIGH